MNAKDRHYEEFINAQCDAALAYIAQRVSEEDEEFYGRIEEESREYVVPSHIHDKIASMVSKGKKERARKNRAGTAKRVIKVCAIILLITVSTGLILVNTVDAFKYRFENLMMRVLPNYLDITPKQTRPPGDENFSGWYPAYLPEGYSFKSRQLKGDMAVLTFQGENGGTIKFRSLPALGANLYLDSEGTGTGTIKIGGQYDGFWSEAAGTVTLYWMQEDQLMHLTASLPIEDLQKVAERVVFKK